jgi:hypothetical protein
MPDVTNPRLDRVLQQLRLYEHPLLGFSAQAKGEGVEVSIQLMHCTVPVHTYLYEMHPRDLDHPQFEWQFQRQLYDAATTWSRCLSARRRIASTGASADCDPATENRAGDP